MAAKNEPEIDDRFRRFGTVGFTGITRVNEFIAQLEQGRVAGTRCRDCGQVFFPPRADCRVCFSRQMAWFPVEGTGRLVSWSRLAFGPAGFQEDIPYTIALLDFGDYKVFGRIDRALPEEELSVGLPMKVRVERLPGDRLSYVFVKA